MKIIGLILNNRTLPVFKIHNQIIQSGLVNAGTDNCRLYQHISRLKDINPEVLAEFHEEEKEYER